VSNVYGTAHALSVLTPIRDERAPALRVVLEGLGQGGPSPLARLPGTHLARWVLIPELDFEEFAPGGEQHRTPVYLLFTSTFDGADDDYLAAICAEIPEEADAVWSNCEGYAGTKDPARFADYIRRHRIWTNLFASAYPDADLAEILEALRRREHLIRFAIGAKGLDPEALRSAFRQEFRPDESPRGAELAPAR
jgi:hypothetical protein